MWWRWKIGLGDGYLEVGRGVWRSLPITQSIRETPTEPVAAKIPDGVENTGRK